MNLVTFILNAYFILDILKSVISRRSYSINANGTKIIGQKFYTVFENKPYVAFSKIPYAEPPMDKLRFKPPNILLWTKNFYNYSVIYNETCANGFTEDCLHLTIYLPITNQFAVHPVLVWINEDSNNHGPDFFIDEDLIVVTVSFRTSILGFLNTGDDFATGNMGAKDVLAALKWIRDNISYFNGDINNVTVFGSGVHANIVASSLLSPTAEDLFSRVIIHGGSALSPADYRNYNFEICNKLYWNLNGPFEKFNRTKLYQILSKASISTLLRVSQDLFDSTEVRNDQRLINPFGPTVELARRWAFMNKLPLDVYKRKMINNAVEVMIGYTNLDSLHKLDGYVKNKKLLKYLNYNFQYLLPFEGRKHEYGSKRYREIRRRIMEFYFVNGTIGERSLRRYAKYVSDQVIYPLLRQARLHTETSRNGIYLYRFTYKGSFNIAWNTRFSNLNITGATAGDEICYQFRCKSLKSAYNSPEHSDERHFIKKIVRLLANFAKHGNPTPESTDDILGGLQWSPVLPNGKLRGLHVDKTLKMVNVPEQRRINFWNRLRNELFVDKESHDEL